MSLFSAFYLSPSSWLPLLTPCVSPSLPFSPLFISTAGFLPWTVVVFFFLLLHFGFSNNIQTDFSLFFYDAFFSAGFSGNFMLRTLTCKHLGVYLFFSLLLFRWFATMREWQLHFVCNQTQRDGLKVVNILVESRGFSSLFKPGRLPLHKQTSGN